VISKADLEQPSCVASKRLSRDNLVEAIGQSQFWSYIGTSQEAFMADNTAIFTGAVTTTGRSEALRFEKAFFRANPEFRQQAKVTARVVGPGHVLVAVEDQPNTASERDPIVAAFLAFLERDMVSNPSGLVAPPGGQADKLKALLEGVAVSDDEGLPDDVTF